VAARTHGHGRSHVTARYSWFQGSADWRTIFTSLVLNSITSKVYSFSLAQKQASSRTKTKKGCTTTKEVSTMRNHQTSSSFFNSKMCPLQNPRYQNRRHTGEHGIVWPFAQFSNILMIPSRDGHLGHLSP
jgi:hypothetical protein